MTSVLLAKDLGLSYVTREGRVHAVTGVSFELQRGEIVGLVGESGSGKSALTSLLHGVLPPNARQDSGSLLLEGEPFVPSDEGHRVRICGSRIGYVFQDPVGSFNPSLTVGDQLVETHLAHAPPGTDKKTATERAETLLHEMGISHARERMHSYPYQLSGGMLQRAMIAMAMINDPVLIVADEPTTALDASVQAQVLRLLHGVVRNRAMTLLLVTHDMGVVEGICDRILVMYDGEIVEAGTVRDLLSDPWHPYTRDLVESHRVIRHRKGGAVLANLDQRGDRSGCRFLARCPSAQRGCQVHPALTAVEHRLLRCPPSGARHGREPVLGIDAATAPAHA